MTGACENITLPRLRLRAVKNKRHSLSMSVGGEVLFAEDEYDFLGHKHVVADLGVVPRPSRDVPLIVTELKVPGELYSGHLHVSPVHLWKQVLFRKRAHHFSRAKQNLLYINRLFFPDCELCLPVLEDLEKIVPVT